jgi:hypothetical protein
MYRNAVRSAAGPAAVWLERGFCSQGICLGFLKIVRPIRHNGFVKN